MIMMNQKQMLDQANSKEAEDLALRGELPLTKDCYGTTTGYIQDLSSCRT